MEGGLIVQDVVAPGGTSRFGGRRTIFAGGWLWGLIRKYLYGLG